MKSFIKQLLTIIIAMILPVAGLAETGEQPAVSAQIPASTEPEIPKNVNADTQGPVKHKSDTQTPEPSKPTESETKPKFTRIERIVMPFTQWVEEKVQDSSLINPVERPSPKKAAPATPDFGVREAIDQARKQYKGTVLSAERIEQNGHVSYSVKILSPDGVVNTIQINNGRYPR